MKIKLRRPVGWFSRGHGKGRQSIPIIPKAKKRYVFSGYKMPGTEAIEISSNELPQWAFDAGHPIAGHTYYYDGDVLMVNCPKLSRAVDARDGCGCECTEVPEEVPEESGAEPSEEKVENPPPPPPPEKG